MMGLMNLIIAWLVTAVSLFLIAKLSKFTGVEIEDYE